MVKHLGFRTYHRDSNAFHWNLYILDATVPFITRSLTCLCGPVCVTISPGRPPMLKFDLVTDRRLSVASTSEPGDVPVICFPIFFFIFSLSLRGICWRDRGVRNTSAPGVPGATAQSWPRVGTGVVWTRACSLQHGKACASRGCDTPATVYPMVRDSRDSRS